MKNSEVINGPDYYVLPCGRQVEDFIWAKKMPFAVGSAFKYRYRAGKKDGESHDKDTNKMVHYTNFLEAASPRKDGRYWDTVIEELYSEAMSWDGKSKLPTLDMSDGMRTVVLGEFESKWIARMIEGWKIPCQDLVNLRECLLRKFS